MDRTKIFISYSHRDGVWLDCVMEHLAALERWGLISAWSDTRIEIGSACEREIEGALGEAKVAVVLVSPSFLASRYIWEKEMPSILRHVDAGMELFPLIVRPCAWRLEEALAGRQARPADGRALSIGSDAQIDLDLTAFVYELAELLEKSTPGLASEERDRTVRQRGAAMSSSSQRPIMTVDEDFTRVRVTAEVIPRHWSGLYNQSLDFDLTVETVDGDEFHGMLRYRDGPHPVAGTVHTSPKEIDATAAALAVRRATSASFSLRFVEEPYSESPGMRAEYRALVFENEMVGSWFSDGRRVADFELGAV
jgi:TIR domain